LILNRHLQFQFLLLCSFSSITALCVLKMGYKDGEKKPLIGSNGDNTGAYKDIFAEADEDIGSQLVIYRLSK